MACVTLACPKAVGTPAATPGASPVAGRNAPAETGDVVAEQPATIRKVGSFGFGIVPDADPGTRYAPHELAEEFRVDGLRVVFSGRLTEPPEGVRLWGTPLRLETIRRAER